MPPWGRITATMQFGGDWHLLPMPKISWFVCDQAAIDNGVFALQGEDPVAEASVTRPTRSRSLLLRQIFLPSSSLKLLTFGIPIARTGRIRPSSGRRIH